MQFDGRTFILNHLANLKKAYNENQKRKAVPVKKNKARSKYIPFFPEVAHSSNYIGKTLNLSDKEWRDYVKKEIV